MQNEIFWNENTRYEIYNPYKEQLNTLKYEENNYHFGNSCTIRVQ